MPNILWIVNPNEEFSGNNVHTLTLRDDGTYSNIHYQKEPISFEEFNSKSGGNLKIMSYEEFNRDWAEPYYRSLQKPWVETTQEKYCEMLGCVPPLKFTA